MARRRVRLASRFTAADETERNGAACTHRAQDDGAGGLDIGQRVTDALCAIVAELTTFPDFLVAKGGITSNDVAVEASNSYTVCYDENQTF